MDDSHGIKRMAIILARFPDYAEPADWQNSWRASAEKFRSYIENLLGGQAELEIKLFGPIRVRNRDSYPVLTEAMEDSIRLAEPHLGNQELACVLFNGPDTESSEHYQSYPAGYFFPRSSIISAIFLQFSAALELLERIG